MKKTSEPIILAANGKAELVVQDGESYQELLEAKLDTFKPLKREASPLGSSD
jgi:hypothetical protein